MKDCSESWNAAIDMAIATLLLQGMKDENESYTKWAVALLEGLKK